MTRTWNFLRAVLLFVISIHAQAPAQKVPGIPRMPDGKPNYTGLWQALGTAYWDIRDHSAMNGRRFVR